MMMYVLASFSRCVVFKKKQFHFTICLMLMKVCELRSETERDGALSYMT
jgi:hypothetical protein